MNCVNCKYLDVNNKKEGKVNGCLYYCKLRQEKQGQRPALIKSITACGEHSGMSISTDASTIFSR